MRKTLLVCTLLVAVASPAFAAKPELPRDGQGMKIQGFAPSGKKSVQLTVNSQNINHSDDIRWSVYTPTACGFRLMSTATKVGIKHTLPANAVTERAVNSATPYVNYSGCTNGELQVQ